ncbi:MAG: hypothetical protein IJ751_02820 [Oscillospiraceae bacterium]|nr:hypothetical protein [Oscillospiraceae bacterium]
MLRKIFHYELRDLGRKFGLLYGVLLGLCAVTSVYTLIRGNAAGGGGIADTVFMVVFLISIVAMCTAMGIITLFLPLDRYCKQLFSNQGYLIHTLPVKPWQQVAGRGLAALIFQVLSTLAIVVSIAVLVVPGMIGSWNEIRQDLLAELRILFSGTVHGLNLPFPVFLALVALAVLIVLVNLILMLMACLTLGHTVGRCKSLITAVSVIALLELEGNLYGLIVPSFTILPANDGVSFQYLGTSPVRAALGMLLIVAFSALYFCAAEYLLRKHLNLK